MIFRYVAGETGFRLRNGPEERSAGAGGPQPAFSSKAQLIFCVMTISFVTTNSRTFLYEGR